MYTTLIMVAVHNVKIRRFFFFELVSEYSEKYTSFEKQWRLQSNYFLMKRNDLYWIRWKMLRFHIFLNLILVQHLIWNYFENHSNGNMEYPVINFFEWNKEHCNRFDEEKNWIDNDWRICCEQSFAFHCAHISKKRHIQCEEKSFLSFYSFFHIFFFFTFSFSFAQISDEITQRKNSIKSW